jgi:acyl-CoA hydrolase
MKFGLSSRASAKSVTASSKALHCSYSPPASKFGIPTAVNKAIISAAEAVIDIPSGSSLAVGGFGVCGVPDSLLEAFLVAGSRDLTVYSTTAASTA